MVAAGGLAETLIMDIGDETPVCSENCGGALVRTNIFEWLPLKPSGFDFRTSSDGRLDSDSMTRGNGT